MSQSPPDTILDPHYLAALEADAAIQLKRLKFDDRVGRTRLLSLIHEAYSHELMVIAQLSRWYEIRLVTPQELDVPNFVALMIDLRRRIQASPATYIPSAAMGYTFRRMMEWWQDHTITSSWRSVKAHVRAPQPSTDLADELADFLWNVRELLSTPTPGEKQ